MLKWAAIFFIIAIIAAIFGFGGLASAAAGIAKVLFFIFLVIFVVCLVMGLIVGRGCSDAHLDARGQARAPRRRERGEHARQRFHPEGLLEDWTVAVRLAQRGWRSPVTKAKGMARAASASATA